MNVANPTLENEKELIGIDMPITRGAGVSVGVGVGVSVGVGVDVLVGVVVDVGVEVAVGVWVGVDVSVGVGVGVSRAKDIIALPAPPSGGPPPKGIETVTDALAGNAFVEITVTLLSFSPETQLPGKGLRTIAEPRRTTAPPSAIFPIEPEGLLPHRKQAPSVSVSCTP